jgi:hypothetical protein
MVFLLDYPKIYPKVIQKMYFYLLDKLLLLNLFYSLFILFIYILPLK